jgi:hypothetical protein
MKLERQKINQIFCDADCAEIIAIQMIFLFFSFTLQPSWSLVLSLQTFPYVRQAEGHLGDQGVDERME